MSPHTMWRRLGALILLLLGVAFLNALLTSCDRYRVRWAQEGAR